MQDSRLLSTLPPSPTAGLFHPCQASTALRALLYVQSVLAVGVMFGSAGASQWLVEFAVYTVGTLPATLLWLVAACMVQSRLKPGAGPTTPYLVFVLLGALSGWVASSILDALGLLLHARPLACCLAGAMLSAGLVGMQSWRNKALQPSDTQGRLRELQARIRPHFLFNTLNSAIALLRAEPAKAENLLLDLSELFRAALSENQTAWTLGQELDLARKYLDIETVRYGSRLRITWDLDPQAEGALLPPLILQPLVENAVQHGVEPDPDGADLLVRTRKSATGVMILVSNTHRALQDSRGHGMALSNVRERLALMHDLESHFQCTQRNGRFEVRMEVPA